ncbi:uncharacterized protein AKAW2_61076A [Aspergillus luchuensis]|uniref:C6 zinc finger domain protein n=1 Tax=Aspergillus kawachii TaxID=1069201 RepID=A0A146EXR9_ASPKA|nr:uncharacterized protein AKAW2_61076A [Aspergillus luchuensis]BCS02812.1 hypothetical protein AKAW2_61076A [Aspergillus luchuensis]BCS14464.1 hypothetical protein ALUC_61020A [Aspergillus luchuensis]GAA87605.1 C6 zinc finger domain protein [Aspergillus luchuensis IFO 4308]GAT18846.1 C6 zinc finger domain protein [Aspergillus luchuensis]
MSTISKRKRARKACNPCHQRKRRCDNQYPCGMCTTYDYSCRYDDDATGTVGDSVDDPPHAKRISVDGRSRLANRPHVEQGHREAKANSSSTKSPATVTSTPPGLFDEQKFRYTGASAAMAFPHVLGVNLGGDSPPRLRSCAYNFGNRPDEASNPHSFLGDLISEQDLSHYAGVYFTVMNPIGDILDPRLFADRCHQYYDGGYSTDITFAAVAAGVACLGSFLSSDRHPRETDLVLYAKAILDDPASMRTLNIDHIIAWDMRAFYLRATSRPKIAWIASCTVMHLCETVGLHDEASIKKIASKAGAAALGLDADRLRRIFWASWAAHNMLSYEQDCSAVHFRSVTCQSFIPTPGSVADQFVRLVQCTPAPNSPFRLYSEPADLNEELFERLRAVTELKVTHPFLVVTAADIAFCFYRRLYQAQALPSAEFISLIIDCGNAGLKAAEQLANEGHLFWNVLGSVFQYACVLLAIDSPIASAHLGTVFKRLENLVKAADTTLTREALSIARHLLSLKTAKKRKELAELEAVEAGFQSGLTPPEPEANASMPDISWELYWDQFFLEPYLPMFSGEIQL